MGQQNTKHASHTKSCQNARPLQAARRQERLAREHKKLTNKMAKATAKGRSVAGLTRALEQVEYAMSYDRPEGKKGRKGLPEGGVTPPHASKPFEGRGQFKQTHTQVFYRTARSLGVPHGGYVTNKTFKKYCEAGQTPE